jgi:hypothetical protein
MTIPTPECMDCGVDTTVATEVYMVHDELWRSVVPEEAGMLCVGCFEKRLGRKLCRNDFRPYTIRAVEEWMPASERLKDRVTRHG